MGYITSFPSPANILQKSQMIKYIYKVIYNNKHAIIEKNAPGQLSHVQQTEETQLGSILRRYLHMFSLSLLKPLFHAYTYHNKRWTEYMWDYF